MVKVRKDLVGITFGRLTVLKQADDYITPKGAHLAMWHCKCQCGNDYIAEGRHLQRGDTKSCGCYNLEMLRLRNKKYNDFLRIDDYVVLYTFKGEEIYVDLEYFEKVRNICWHINKSGYVTSGTGIYMHRLIMGEPVGLDVDHIGGKETRCDNRKFNLRIATRSQNQQNHPVRSDNKTGVTGVGYKEDTQSWYAEIRVDNKNIWLGSFMSLDDAIDARKRAENFFFGDFSYKNSQKLYNDCCSR